MKRGSFSRCLSYRFEDLQRRLGRYPFRDWTVEAVAGEIAR